MAKQTVAGTDPVSDYRIKFNANFTELYDALANLKASSVEVENGMVIVNAGDLQTAIEDIDTALTYTLSTGVVLGGDLSVNAGDVSKVDISACTGIIVDNSNPASISYYKIDYAGATALTVAETGTPLTYWYLDNTTTLNQTTTPLTRSQMRTSIYLGFTSFAGGVVLAAIAEPAPILQEVEQMRDFTSFLGELQAGLNVSPASTDLTVAVAAGESFGFGRNIHNSATNPHVTTIDAVSPTTFQMATQNGGSGSDITALDASNYDVGGTITAIPGASTRATIFTVYVFSGTAAYRIQYGNEWYTSLTSAHDALKSGDHDIILPPVYQNALRIGYLIAQSGATDLSVGAGESIFRQTNRFGDLV